MNGTKFLFMHEHILSSLSEHINNALVKKENLEKSFYLFFIFHFFVRERQVNICYSFISLFILFFLCIIQILYFMLSYLGYAYEWIKCKSKENIKNYVIVIARFDCNLRSSKILLISERTY